MVDHWFWPPVLFVCFEGWYSWLYPWVLFLKISLMPGSLCLFYPSVCHWYSSLRPGVYSSMYHRLQSLSPALFLSWGLMLFLCSSYLWSKLRCAAQRGPCPYLSRPPCLWACVRTWLRRHHRSEAAGRLAGCLDCAQRQHMHCGLLLSGCDVTSGPGSRNCRSSIPGGMGQGDAQQIIRRKYDIIPQLGFGLPLTAIQPHPPCVWLFSR